MNAFDHLAGIDDLTRGPDEDWFVEPRDRGLASEEQRQQTVLKMLHRLAPGCLVWAVPNGGKRTPWAAQKAKREGMLAGAPDLTITWPGGSFYAEMKDGTGAPTPYQRDVLNALHRQGHHCGVYRTAETLIAHLRAAGAPVREARF